MTTLDFLSACHTCVSLLLSIVHLFPSVSLNLLCLPLNYLSVFRSSSNGVPSNPRPTRLPDTEPPHPNTTNHTPAHLSPCPPISSPPRCPPNHPCLPDRLPLSLGRWHGAGRGILTVSSFPRLCWPPRSTPRLGDHISSSCYMHTSPLTCPPTAWVSCRYLHIY